MSLISKLRGLTRPTQPSVPDQPIVYRAIGVVRNRVRQPRVEGWQDVCSDIVLRDDLLAALEDIEGFSHVIVVFHLDRVPEEARRLQLPVGTDAAERGVLATRSQRRPNPVGVAVAAVLERRGTVLRVQGLDALDGTPVLDLKPYLPAYDAVATATLPPWAQSPGAEGS